MPSTAVTRVLETAIETAASVRAVNTSAGTRFGTRTLFSKFSILGSRDTAVLYILLDIQGPQGSSFGK